MRLLLLSWGIGALPEFLDTAVDRSRADLRLGYLNDAALPYGDAEFAAIDRTRLTALGYRPEVVTARDYACAEDFADRLDRLDALYVCGGETYVLLDHLRRGGLDRVLTDRVRGGLPYVGLSAGAVLAGASTEPVSLMDDLSTAPGLTDLRGLGLLEASVVPHADGAIPQYPASLISRVVDTYGPRMPLLLLHDDQALLVTDGDVTVIDSP